MAMFAGYNVMFVEGAPSGPMVKMKKHERLGVDGVSVEWVQTAADETTLELSSREANMTAANNLMRALEGTVGNVVSFTTSNGQSWTNFLVLSVKPKTIRAVGPGVFQGWVYPAGWWVEATVTVQYLYGS